MNNPNQNAIIDKVGENPSDFSDCVSFSLQTKENPSGRALIGHDTCRYGETICLTVSLPRSLAARNGRIRLFRDDDGEVLFFPLPSVAEASPDVDRFEISLETASLCQTGEKSGLFYYRFEFDTDRGHCFFSKAPDSLLPVLRFRDENIASFQLTVIQADSEAPQWMRGGIMYHIFVDRFAKGEETMRRRHVSIPVRSDAFYNDDWYHGIPQHARIPGGEVKNNEFFGGTLWGVAEKLPYLQSLGVTTLYLSPIFRAYSNHKYDTGDYESVDPSFGGEEAFLYLLSEAKRCGIRILCDGVFNHTGDDSRYFNRYGHYPDCGAYQSDGSPYASWYRFKTKDNKEEYDCWWGVKVLPALNSGEPSLRRYFCGENGILQRWMKKGVSGWRLDVADELDDRFLCDLHDRVKKEDTEGLILGEVWEDASFKIAYDRRRRYFRGSQLDSVMNYPFRDGILSYLKTRNALGLIETVKEIVSHYPSGAVHNLMNLLGTHDTERILTVLAGEPAGDRDNDALTLLKMSPAERESGLYLVRIAALIQFTLPGVPCIYYGDEAGMEGYRDPFNRRPYPWGKEDDELIEWYRLLGQVRHDYRQVFASGDIAFPASDETASRGVLLFSRTADYGKLLTIVNLGREPFILSGMFSSLLPVSASKKTPGHDVILTSDSITVPAGSAALVEDTAGRTDGTR